jgi:hypothetical protein
LSGQCHAKSKRTGLPCKEPAMRGQSVCYHHGGKSLRGIASPRYKTGEYSKYLPTAMAKDYIRVLNDPELLACRRDIALNEARLLDVLKRVSAGESGKLWLLLDSTYEAMLEAKAKGDGAEVAAKLNMLGDLIKRGKGDYAAWGEIREIMEAGRKLRETEHKRLIAMQQMITNEQAMNLVAALVGTVRSHISDRATLAAISDDLVRLVNREPSTRLIAGDDTE